MPFSAAEILLGFVLPAVFAAGMFLALARTSPEGVLGRFGPALAFAGGFLLGYFLLRLGPVAPESHWHWLPYGVLLALIVGPVSRAAGVTWVERVLLYALVAAVAGWWLVPTWEDLEPSRTSQLLFWAALVVLSASLLEPLAGRFSGSLLGLVLFFTMVCASGVLALGGSLRFAQIAGAGAGSLAGLAIVARWGREVDSLQGVAMGFVILIWGSLLVGRVNSFSSVPLASYVLLPLAPLSLWLFARGPLSRLEGAKRTLIAISLPLAIAGCAVILAAVAEL
jgi:hypothetical protein